MPSEGYEIITPASCRISTDNTNNRLCNAGIRNGLIWKRSSDNEWGDCDNARITFYFKDNVDIDYISVSNFNKRKAFKTRDRLRIINVTYGKDKEYISDRLVLEDIRKTQSFRVNSPINRQINQVNIEILGTWESEKYMGSDPKNECVMFIQFRSWKY